MIIDFHTHIFPDEIAAKTIPVLAQHGNIKPHLSGTLQDLIQSMHQHNIDYSVVLPIVTHPKQFDSINRFASDINGKNGVFSLGSIHPDNEDIPEKLEYIKSLGLKGVKLHPDYQDTFINDARYIHILQECIRLDLCCVIHAGVDIGMPSPVHCPPDLMRQALSQVLPDCNADSKIILAHMGGYLQWEMVKEYLVGQNVYLDLSFSKGKIDPDLLIHIIMEHGSDRILYATDSPWAPQNDMIEFVKNLPLDDEDKENIFYKNAGKLLGFDL